MAGNFIAKYIPFPLACRLRGLQQGANNVGNDSQNRAALYAAAVAQANSSSGVVGTWAKWRTASVNTAHGSINAANNLLICPQFNPHWVAPPGTYGDPQTAGGGANSFNLTTSASSTYEGVFQESGYIVTGEAGFIGWCTLGSNFGSVSSTPTIAGANVAAIMQDAYNGLWVIVPGSLSKSSFTSIEVNSTTLLTSSGTTGFFQNSGYSGWYFEFPDVFAATTEYSITIT